MRTKLRIAALFLALAVLGFWFFGGPNLGFTKTSVAQIRKDPVTGLEVNDYVPRFVPGVDFLAAGLAAATAIAASSWLIRKQAGP